MTESLPHKINLAALQMANELNQDHAKCKELILYFLGSKDEAQFYNLELTDQGTARTKGVRHVLRNSRKITIFDLGESLTILAGLEFIEQNIDTFLSIITGGLFLMRIIKNATTIDLSAEDASVVWALHTLGGLANKEKLLKSWGSIVSESEIVDATVTPEKLKARLNHLKELGCILESGNQVYFAEPVEFEE